MRQRRASDYASDIVALYVTMPLMLRPDLFMFSGEGRLNLETEEPHVFDQGKNCARHESAFSKLSHSR